MERESFLKGRAKFVLPNTRGAASPRAALSREQACEIFEARHCSAQSLAKRYNVTTRTIYKIWARKAYATDTQGCTSRGLSAAV